MLRDTLPGDAPPAVTLTPPVIASNDPGDRLLLRAPALTPRGAEQAEQVCTHTERTPPEARSPAFDQ
ncbi:hypothetical protein [Tateyamaria sp.]|uniref:hypothetical protein n=1 Tax=Tateyamaria sp. TaxID=1929288 RepID=UPI0039B9B24E